MSKKGTIGGRLSKICQCANQEDFGKWGESDVKTVRIVRWRGVWICHGINIIYIRYEKRLDE